MTADECANVLKNAEDVITLEAATGRNFATPLAKVVIRLLRELDAVRAERDAIEKERNDLRIRVEDLSHERTIARRQRDDIADERDGLTRELAVWRSGKLPTLENMRDEKGRAPWDCPECGVGLPNHGIGCPRIARQAPRTGG